MGLASSLPQSDEEFEPFFEGQIVNIYEGVGVSPDATLQQIKAVYQARSKSVHPDKQGHDSRSPHNSSATLHSPLSSAILTALADSTGDPAHEEQARLNKYKVTLESTHRRAFYDCVTEYRYPHLTQRERMVMYHKYRMESYYNFLQSIRDELAAFQNTDSRLYSPRAGATAAGKDLMASTETANSNSNSIAHGKLIDGLLDPDGIFIIQALYGDFVRDTARFGNDASTPGTAIDVTWAVRQAIYNNNTGLTHTVEFQPDGWDDFYSMDKTFKFNQGFLDPNFLIPNWDGTNRLYISYTRGGLLFQGIWDDGETIILPSPHHWIEEPIHWSQSKSYNQFKPSLTFNPAEDYDEEEYSEYEPSWSIFLNLPVMSDEFLAYTIATDHNLHNQDVITAPSIHSIDTDSTNGLDQSVGSSTSDGSGKGKHNLSVSIGSSQNSLPDSDLFLSSLSYLPQYLRGQPLYSPEGVVIPSDVWDGRMKSIKAKRRRNLYFALGILVSSVVGSLQWAGVIDLSPISQRITQTGTDLIGYAKQYRREQNEETGSTAAGDV